MATSEKKHLYQSVSKKAKSSNFSDRVKKRLAQGRLVVSSGHLPLDSVRRRDIIKNERFNKTFAIGNDVLDLSDNENGNERRIPEVMVLDATRSLDNLDTTEVDVVTGFEMSQARVICHQYPSHDSCSLNRSNSVAVDRVPKLNLDLSLHSSKDVPQEIDLPEAAAVSPLHSSRSLRSIHNDDDELLDRSLSLADHCRPTLNMTNGESHRSSAKSEKKKSKYKFVESRHTRAASKIADQGQTMANTRHVNKMATLQITKDADTSKKNSSMKNGVKTSTPTREIPTFVAFDASSIYPDPRASCVNNPTKTSQAESCTSEESKKFKYPTEFISSTKNSSDKSKHVLNTHREVNVLYAKYLGWLYLSSTMDRVLKNHRISAMAQLYSEWEELEALRKRKAELQELLMTLQHNYELDETLEVFREGLGPVVTNIPQFSHDHGSLASAISPTLHHLPIKDIDVGNSKDSFDETLVGSLQETNLLLERTNQLQDGSHEVYSELASNISSLESIRSKEIKSLDQLEGFVSRLMGLTVEETSLKIHTSQINPN